MDRAGIIRICNRIGAQNMLTQGANVQISCPLAPWRAGHKRGKDSTPSMGILVNPNGESLVHCFACKFGGTFERLISELNRLSGENLTGVLIEVIELEEQDPEALLASIGEYDEEAKTYKHKIIEEDRIAPMMGLASRYLLERRLKIDTLKAWSCGFDRERKRAIFTVRMGDGSLVGVVGRATRVYQKPKYLNYFHFDKGRYLYGEHMVRPGSALVVVEGMVDTLSTWQQFEEAQALDEFSVVASMGADMTKHQLDLMVRLSDEVILFLDDNPAGWTGQLSAARYLQDKVVLKSILYPRGMGDDPDKLAKFGVNLADLARNANLIAV